MVLAITPRVLIEDLAYYSAGGFALWKGGRSERLVAGALLLENTLSLFVQDMRHLETPRYVSLSMDFSVLLVILFVAFTTDLRWALLASALQILSTLTFVARIIDPSIRSWAYVTVDIAISFALMGSVDYGAAVHMRRSKPPRSRAISGGFG